MGIVSRSFSWQVTNDVANLDLFSTKLLSTSAPKVKMLVSMSGISSVVSRLGMKPELRADARIHINLYCTMHYGNHLSIIHVNHGLNELPVYLLH